MNRASERFSTSNKKLEVSVSPGVAVASSSYWSFVTYSLVPWVSQPQVWGQLVCRHLYLCEGFCGIPVRGQRDSLADPMYTLGA